MILLKKDGTNNIRVVNIDLVQHDSGVYVIERNTGLLGGAMTQQPDHIISYGKASRSILEQAKLEYTSEINSYNDKGYKSIKLYGINALSEITPDIRYRIVTDKVVDTNGAHKHMLAKTAFESTDARYKALWLGSYKIDGVRCSLRYNSATKKIVTASRGGKHFEYSTHHLTDDPTLLQLFEEHPDLILDGELYIHGKPLQYLQGLAKTKYYDTNVHAKLHFYVFDVVADVSFAERLKIIKHVSAVLSELAALSGNFAIIDYVRFVGHTEVKGYDSVMLLHNEAINNGYEGLVLRDPKSDYGYGTRDWRMIKVKVFQDDEFVIVGMSEGRREEDMVFRLSTKNGQVFEAKPVGARMLREHYSRNAEAYIGKYACIKFFGYTEAGIPNLPILKYILD